MIRNKVLKQRYFRKNDAGEPIENWVGLCDRVSTKLATNEDERLDFYDVLVQSQFLPNTPALVNAGREKFSMSACFVLPIEDSMEGIFDAVKYAALIHKAGGGTGFSFSRLRPKGEMVGTTKGVSSGPCSFIRVFDTATDVTKQGGTRKGANMGILRVDHPDIMEFINLKKKDGVLSNFNLSIGITNEFMAALEADSDFHLTFNGKIKKTMKAATIWKAIVDSAWHNGDPGVVFLDKMNAGNKTPNAGDFEATNPCGEQPLLPFEACVLGSINLSKMVIDGSIDWVQLGKVINTAVRMLDNIIDLQHYPLPEIEKMHKSNRKIGLGVMGWADLLIMLRIHYESDEAVKLAKEVMSFVTMTSEQASSNLSEEKGCFPNWESSVWHKAGLKMRNATTTTIAPTGSISIIAECSSGIEPVIEFESIQTRCDDSIKVSHPLYEEWLAKNKGNKLPSYFVTAGKISIESHIRMQAAFQEFTHNAVSKTINLPCNATKEDVEKAYLLAYELGCKGVTVYRDGSRENQVITAVPSFTQIEPDADKEELQLVLDSKRIAIETPDGKVYVHVSIVDNKPYEMFITAPVKSKQAEIYEGFARVFSVALRYGIPANVLLHQLEEANKKFGSVVSIPYALIRAFRMIKLNGNDKETCPDCGGTLILEEGCVKCWTCGFTKC